MKKQKRCLWPHNDQKMITYHDSEWGVPIYNDRKIFEFIVLESAQAGLSWRTILYRRNGYKKAFANFNPKKVALFSKKDIARLLKDENIIRNRLKILATIHNAKLFLEIQKEFGTFSHYMWQFVQNKPIDGKRKESKNIPAITPEAELFSKDLKKRGFKFMGPTIVYAHMQAVGMVNDHTIDCFRYREVKREVR